MSDDEDLPRSIHGDCQVLRIFVNTTPRAVDLYWVDYAGSCRHYSTLNPGENYAQVTYATHPWVALDSESRQRVHLDGRSVHVPTEPGPEEDPDTAITVVIHVPESPPTMPPPVDSSMPRSIHSHCPVPINFYNASQRTIDVFWLDFQGKLVRYVTNLEPGGRYNINTYATHPWVARDCATGQRMLLDGQDVYFPAKPDRNRHRDFDHWIQVSVNIPVFRLEDVCIGHLRRTMDESELQNLEVNSCLKKKLCIPKLETKVYQPGH